MTTRSCRALHPTAQVQCQRSDWPGHEYLPHVYYASRSAMEADRPTLEWSDENTPGAYGSVDRRPLAGPSLPTPEVEGAALPVFAGLMREVFGR